MADSPPLQLGTFGPIIVATIVVAILVATWPIETKLGGISMNWVAIVGIALAGLLSTLEELG